MKNYYVLFFCLSITLHNIEEAIWLPNWSNSPFQKTVLPHEFYFAVICITLFAYLVTFLYLKFPIVNVIKWTFIGFLGAMILNAIFPHLIATFVMKSYAPGLATALLLNIPINTAILYKLKSLKLITMKEIIFSSIIIGIILSAAIPLLFTLWGILIND